MDSFRNFCQQIDDSFGFVDETYFDRAEELTRRKRELFDRFYERYEQEKNSEKWKFFTSNDLTCQ